MYLYEKEGNIVSVYELKVLKDKLFEYRRKEMEKLNKHELVYKILSNNAHDIMSAREFGYCDESKFITKKNKFFIHKRGLKLESVNYFLENEIIIDGLIYQICNGDHDLKSKQFDVYNRNDAIKHFILTDQHLYINDRNIFKINGEFYKYELSNVVNIPESIY